MLRKHVSEPHRVVCITDSPAGITECETFPLWPLIKGGKRAWNCYHRLRLFDPDVARQFGERIVSIDLDVVVTGDLSEIMPRGKLGFLKGAVSTWNGSMWYLEPGLGAHLWRDWRGEESIAEVERHRFAESGPTKGWRGTDQIWISLRTSPADVVTWTPDDGVVLYHSMKKNPDWTASRAVFFPGQKKPWSPYCAVETPDLWRAYLNAYDPKLAVPTGYRAMLDHSKRLFRHINAGLEG